MGEQPSRRVAAITGPEKAVPWPTPPIPGTSMLTFWGSGDASTEEFALPADASVRMTFEKGPAAVRVLRPDGTEGATVAPIADAGLALGQIPAAGTYALEVRAAGSWGVTVVFFTPRG